jgi:hypothetical protein
MQGPSPDLAWELTTAIAAKLLEVAIIAARSDSIVISAPHGRPNFSTKSEA